MNETFLEARRLLVGLLSGQVGREEVADWALDRIKDEEKNYSANTALWNLLDRLSGVDLKRSPESYLHGIEDFEAWLADAEASVTRGASFLSAPDVSND
ncbi:hypothetical protein [Streptomyces scopuliridis]|uniref:hypothetical protein n=1 Tax=Streptomyces scopuliridis TaxID=452529 RepID=UPI0036C7C1AD